LTSKARAISSILDFNKELKRKKREKRKLRSIMATAYICPMCVFNCDNLPDLEQHLEGE
jgi:hypothetical protein